MNSLSASSAPSPAPEDPQNQDPLNNWSSRASLSRENVTRAGIGVVEVAASVGTAWACFTGVSTLEQSTQRIVDEYWKSPIALIDTPDTTLRITPDRMLPKDLVIQGINSCGRTIEFSVGTVAFVETIFQLRKYIKEEETDWIKNLNGAQYRGLFFGAVGGVASASKSTWGGFFTSLIGGAFIGSVVGQVIAAMGSLSRWTLNKIQ